MAEMAPTLPECISRLTNLRRLALDGKFPKLGLSSDELPTDFSTLGSLKQLTVKRYA